MFDQEFSIEFKSPTTAFITFVHEYALSSQLGTKAVLYLWYEDDEEFYFGLKALQATRPDEVLRLISHLKQKLEDISLTTHNIALLERLIESLSNLSEKRLALIDFSTIIDLDAF